MLVRAVTCYEFASPFDEYGRPYRRTSDARPYMGIKDIL